MGRGPPPRLQLFKTLDQKLKELEAAKDAARLFLKEYDDKHAALLGFPPPTRVHQAEDMEVELQSIKAARVSWGGGMDAFLCSHRAALPSCDRHIPQLTAHAAPPAVPPRPRSE